MITEDYVNFETAKLLKEKRFDIPCDYAYNNKAGHFEVDRSNFDEVYCFRPSLAMAMKWLREVHHIYIEICLYKTNKDDIEPKKSRKSPYYTFGVWDTITGNNVDKRLTNDFIGDTYEQACEAAIKYCLENLI